MKKIPKLKNFDAFILEKKNTQRETAISTAVSKLKERYGHTTDQFLMSVKKEGVDAIKDYILKILAPYMDKIETEEKEPNGLLRFDYDGLLSGLISWCLVELELQVIKKQRP